MEEYQEKISQGLFPIKNGHLLTEEDLIIRKNILDLMCRGYTEIDKNTFEPLVLEDIIKELSLFEKDGLLTIKNNLISSY